MPWQVTLPASAMAVEQIDERPDEPGACEQPCRRVLFRSKLRP